MRSTIVSIQLIVLFLAATAHLGKTTCILMFVTSIDVGDFYVVKYNQLN